MTVWYRVTPTRWVLCANVARLGTFVTATTYYGERLPRLKVYLELTDCIFVEKG